MTARRAALLLAIGAIGALAGCGRATDPTSPAQRQRAITQGQLDFGHPSTGALYSKAGYACSATLVGARSVLTAAHCIEPGTRYVFDVEGGPFEVVSAVPHPAHDPSTQLHDLGILRLGVAPRVAPSPISPDPPTVGMPIVIVGSGCTGGPPSSCTYGVKRMTTNTIQTVSPDELRFTDSQGKGGHCDGDSGGPSFATLGGQEVLVGVHSRGSIICGGESVDARVDGQLSWIRQETGDDVSVSPHVAPPPRRDGGDGGGRADAAHRGDARGESKGGGCAVGGAAPQGSVGLLFLLAVALAWPAFTGRGRLPAGQRARQRIPAR